MEGWRQGGLAERGKKNVLERVKELLTRIGLLMEGTLIKVCDDTAPAREQGLGYLAECKRPRAISGIRQPIRPSRSVYLV